MVFLFEIKILALNTRHILIIEYTLSLNEVTFEHFNLNVDWIVEFFTTE